mgnify:CR=1 FL=1
MSRDKEKQRIYNKFYRDKNKDFIKDYNKKYYLNYNANYTKNINCIDCKKLISNHSIRCYKCSGKKLSIMQKGKKRCPLNEKIKNKIAQSERLSKSGYIDPPTFECVNCKKIKECKPYEIEIRKYCSKKCMYVTTLITYKNPSALC